MRALRAAALLLCAAAAAGCGEVAERFGLGRVDPSPEAIVEQGELVVLTRHAPTTFYLDREDRAAGFEADLVNAFARDLGVTVRFVPMDSLEGLFGALGRSKAHLAAAGLTATPARSGRFTMSAGYQSVDAQLVCRRDGVQPRDLAALERIEPVVTRGGSHAELLTRLRAVQPGLHWRESEYSVEALLEQVSAGDIPCTVADSLTLRVNRRYTPELVTPLTLESGQQLAWFLPRGAETLRERVDEWLRTAEASGRLARLRERHFGFADHFDYVDTLAFARGIAGTLPTLRPLFESAAADSGMPWMLLAAVAWQESRWDARARSPTGVRGLMMLTRPTAKSLGVEDRLDAAQSVGGGARYLAQLREKLPASIAEPDRSWIALAAYNIGLGHVLDARTVARQQGLDPDSWMGIKQALPQLASPRVYRRLAHGYAQGRAPVHYVARVRHFHDVLEFHLARREAIAAASAALAP